MEAVVRTIGRPTRGREIAAALVLLAGAAAMALLALSGVPAYRELLLLGGVATVAWLVDGSSRRYVGPGLVALASGLGLTIGQDLGVDPYEHTLVYGGFGIALLVVSHFNPLTARAAGAFLLYTAVTVALASWVVSFPLGWELAGILAVWAVYELVRIGRGPSAAPAPPVGVERAPQRRFEPAGRS